MIIIVLTIILLTFVTAAIYNVMSALLHDKLTAVESQYMLLKIYKSRVFEKMYSK